jgi:hypothetical protein
VTGLFFVVLLLLKSQILLRQGAERRTSHDAPIIGVFGIEYIESFFRFRDPCAFALLHPTVIFTQHLGTLHHS